MKNTALISVYHKKGIYQFAKELESLGWQIIASGGTAKHLKEKGIKVKDIADLVGGGAILGHRVVTLSRKTHAGLLARDIDEDIKELEKLGFPKIDLVCVDLYPLKEEIDNPKSDTDSIIEKTDVGGPTLLHSASKGQRIVVSDPEDRVKVIKWIRAGQPQKKEVIKSLIAKAEKVVSDYTLLSANYHSDDKIKGFIGQRTLECKYGENAWQTAVLEDGLTWKNVSMSNEDSQFLESGKFSVEEIARFFRMPPHKIQLMDKATFSNIEQQSLEFVTDTMMPWFVRWELNLSRQLIDPAEQDELFLEFLIEGLLRGDSKARSEFYKSAILTGWMSRNEARVKENMNPEPGLEDFLEPMNMQDAGDNPGNETRT